MLRRTVICGCSTWNINKLQLSAAKKEAVKLGYPNDKRIEFLCAKGVPYVPQPLYFKQSNYDLIVNPPNQHWEKRQDSLHGILGLPTKHPSKVKDYKAVPQEISFAKFVHDHTEWAAGPDVFVFFRDHVAVKGKGVLIQREQIHGTCTIHAPVTLQHYLVALHTKAAAPTLDIPSWIRRHAKSRMLDGMLFGDGTHADVVLNRILVQPSDWFSCLFADIPKNLKNYGPALLPWWGVASDFSKKWKHLGHAPTDKPLLGHSMLVVGARNHSDGTVRLLIQNWWRDKQFLEVDEQYYSDCMHTSARFCHHTATEDSFP